MAMFKTLESIKEARKAKEYKSLSKNTKAALLDQLELPGEAPVDEIRLENVEEDNSDFTKFLKPYARSNQVLILGGIQVHVIKEVSLNGLFS